MRLFKGTGQGRTAEIQATHTEDWGNNRHKHQCQGNQKAKLRHQRARHHNAEQEYSALQKSLTKVSQCAPVTGGSKLVGIL